MIDKRMLHKHMKEGTQLELEGARKFRGHIHVYVKMVSYASVQICYSF